VASNGSDFLVVWHEVAFSDRTIHGARVTAGGIVADPAGIPISTLAGVQVYPSVASDGQDYLVVWSDDRNRNSASSYFDIYGARVTSAGVVAEPAGIPISTALGEQYLPAVAAGADGYCVVWMDHRSGRSGSFDMYGARLSRTGVVLDPDGILVQLADRDNSAAQAPAVAASGAGFLVVWQDQSIYGKLVNNNGVVPGIGATLISQSAQREESPAVSSNGSEHLVVWLQSQDRRILGARVSPVGMVLDPNGLVISTQAGDSPKVASDGHDFLVVWTGGGVTGARVSSEGALLDPEGIGLNREPGVTSSTAAVASNGKSYLVVWGVSFVPDDDALPAEPFHIHGTRLNGSGEELDASERIFTTGDRNQSLATVASNGQDYLVVWEDGGIFGTRVNNEAISTAYEPIPVSTTEGAKTDLAVASNGEDYLVAWTDSRNFGVSGLDIYGARVTHGGVVLDPDGLPISRETSHQTQPALAANGSDYLVAWTDARNLAASGLDIYGARVNAAGIVADPHGFAINHQDLDQQLPAVSYGGHGRFLVVSQGFPDSSVRTVANLVLGIAPTPRLHIFPKPRGGVILSWVAQEESAYLVQFKDRHDATEWATLGGECVADGPTASMEDNTPSSVRLYRVVQTR
jgi:hypothetical protein